MAKTDRREFIKTGLITTAAVLASGPPVLYGAGRSLAQGTTENAPDVVISHGRNPATMTRAAVDVLGGMKRFVKPGAKVVIKPNMSFASGPQAGSNTHPAVVSEVAKMCVEAGASKISILDNVLQNPQDCLSYSKIPEQCQGIPNTSVSVVKEQRLFREINVDKGVLIKSMGVASEALDAGVLIAVPVGKTHLGAGVSLSMKGMMGLVFDNSRRTFHTNGLHESIVDMVTVLKPHLVVIDGTRILASGGPTGPGEIIPLNVIIASTDMVAADAQMVRMGTWFGKKLQPREVKYINIAAERGLGRMDLDKLDVRHITVS